MRTSLATLASRPGRRASASLALLLLLLSGCEADAGTPSQPVEGLLILTVGEVATLDVLAAKQGSDAAVSIDLPLPASDTSWISAGDGGILVGSTSAGELATSDPVDPQGKAADLAGLDWRPVEAADDAAAQFATPARYATWDPAGRRIAALGGDLEGGGDVTLFLIVPGAGTFTALALKRPALMAPPAWLDANRLALVTGSAAEPAAIVVDATSGKVTKGPAGERRVATSADGAVIATSAGAGAPIVLRSSKGWLAEDGTSVGSVDVPDGFSEAIALALDAHGDRLAIVWLGEDGTPRIDVHDGTDGWRRVSSEAMAGTAPAAVAWLR